MNRKLDRKILRTALIAGGVVLISATAVYAGEARFFNDHYLPNTVINNTDYTSMTSKDVVEDLQELAEDYCLNVKFRDGSVSRVHAEDVGLSYYDDGTAGQILENQDGGLWPLAIFSGETRVVTPSFACDEYSLDSFLSSLPQLQAENMTAPTNAYVDYSEEEKRFVIVRETEGSTINEGLFREALTKALRDGQKELDLSGENNIYTEPEIRSTDPALLQEAETLNSLLQGSLTYQLPYGEKLVLNGKTLRSWLGKDKNGHYYYDEAKWEKNVQKTADKLSAVCNTTWKNKHFHATRKGDIIVEGGTYGYTLNREAEVEALRSLKSSKKDVSRKPSYYTEEKGSSLNDGIGDTYIEVDIDNQHMWYYKKGKLVLETDVVTGTTDGKHNTPKGIWQIQGKQPNATLIGEIQKNGKPEYKTKVGYWMPFYMGCGFHDAWWRGYFGGSIYTYSGSHGCVNMPVSKADELFNNIDVGTVVVIY